MELIELSLQQLDIVKSVLKKYPNLKCCEVNDLIKQEEVRRNKIELNGEEIIKKFLLKYVRFDICDGIGSYEIWKVRRIDNYGNNTYSLYPEKGVVSNVDGIYSIDSYLDNVIIETTDDLKKLTVVTKEEYESEFEKAIKYYKSLKTG